MPNNGLHNVTGSLNLAPVALGLLRKQQAGWQLPAGHFISAKMPLTQARVVYPRPDNETQSTAYCRNAYPGLQYKIPVTVQGGAWPFYYEIVSMPAGATIGQIYGDVDYGVIKWTPPGSGTHSFHIRVHDQDGATVDVTWSATVGTSWAIFVDPVNGSDANAGTLAAPKQTIDGAWAAASGGKHLILRGGTHYQGATQSFSSSTVLGIVGYPGEVATIDGSTKSATSGNHFWLNNNDLTIQDLRFINTITTVDNPRWFASLQPNDRVTQVFCTFENGLQGTGLGGGDDNNSCLFLGNPGSIRNYIVQSHCVFRGLVGTNNGFSSIDTYSCRYLVCQLNTFDTPATTSSRYCLWIKGGGCLEITVRGNKWTQPWNGTGGAILMLGLGTDGGGDLPGNQEFCYNTILSTNTGVTTANPAIAIATASQSGVRLPVWFYRNTVVGPYWISRTAVELSYLSIENEVVINDCVFYDDISTQMNPQPQYRVSHTWSNDPTNRFRDPALRPLMQQFVMTGIECHGKTTDGVLDGQYKLAGAYRTNWLGKRGAEIA